MSNKTEEYQGTANLSQTVHAFEYKSIFGWTLFLINTMTVKEHEEA